MTNTADMNLELRSRQFKTQLSESARKQQAVCIRKAHKRYGTKRNPYIILDGLNMTVPKGTIYGLLGASGCGKTTLLSCIVGRRRLNSGEIWVLGGTPGSRGSGVPGPRIGYMPQETALYGEFSIRETMKYFGWISNMPTGKVNQRLDFLIKLLLLPSPEKFVKNLSGGQQRRVSLAAALLHEPELLILDEPTVGVDPLLRQNIWDHLVDITKTGNTTVIVTTHYIDETRQAHLIGLMRGGYFLAEASPETLLAQYASDSLEQVFLQLAVKQNLGKRRRSSISSRGIINEAAIIEETDEEISGEFGDYNGIYNGADRIPTIKEDNTIELEIPPEKELSSNRLIYVNCNHMRALVWKNFLWMARNYSMVLFILLLPIVQTVLFCVTIGRDPVFLPLSIFNGEVVDPKNCTFANECDHSHLSCNFLKRLEGTFDLSFYDSLEDSHEKVRAGKSWASLIFKHNFTESLKSRIDHASKTTDEEIFGSEAEIYQDISNQNIGFYVQRTIYTTYVQFLEDHMDACGIYRTLGSIPIIFNEPIYGYKEPNFTDFVAPGAVLSIVFFLAVALTSGAILYERNEGILERSLVNGITGMELLLGHMITEFIIVAFQSILVLLFTFIIFGITQKGPYLLVILLTLLNGFYGMCFGCVISCVCDSEQTATYIALGSFLPMILLCGLMWPLEAIQNVVCQKFHLCGVLEVVSAMLPITKSVESMRSITQRGWTMEHPAVYMGFISTFLWIIVHLIVSILLLNWKKH